MDQSNILMIHLNSILFFKTLLELISIIRDDFSDALNFTYRLNLIILIINSLSIIVNFSLLMPLFEKLKSRFEKVLVIYSRTTE